MLALAVPWCRAADEQGPYSSLPVGRTRPDCSARAPGRLMHSRPWLHVAAARIVAYDLQGYMRHTVLHRVVENG